MTKRIGIIVIALVIAGGLLLCTVAYTVDYTEISLVKTFGRLSQPVYGRTDAGLKFKFPWPIQSLTRYPATGLSLESTMTETQTMDGQNIIVTTYCVWRIDDPAKFHGAIEKVALAEEELRKKLSSYTAAIVGRHDLGHFVNTDRKKMRLPEIEREILELIRRQARDDYGVEVVSVGIKNLGLPESTTAEVIGKMKAERNNTAGTLRAEGRAEADAIRERALAAKTKIETFARSRADSLESEGYRAAKELYPQFKKNERFSMFLRSLKSLERELSGRTVMLLDGSLVPAVKYFRTGPALPKPIDKDIAEKNRK